MRSGLTQKMGRNASSMNDDNPSYGSPGGAIPDPGLLHALKAITEVLAEIRDETRLQRHQLEQIRFSVAYDFFKEYDALISQRQLSFLETLERIAVDGLSLARFGDGELGMAIHPVRDIKFQANSFELSRKLRAIIAEPRADLLVGMPQQAYEKFWVSIFARFWPPLTTFLPQDVMWANSQVSRPIAFEREGQALVHAWRRCWEGKRVSIVTGKGSRFEALPEFFDNTSEMWFEHSLPKNAYSDLPRLHSVIPAARPDVVLISLGPAGTVLASELSQRGIQSLDVGHLTTSYLNALGQGPVPEHLPIRR